MTVGVDPDALLLSILMTDEGRADPYPLYRQLREQAPRCRSALGVVVLSAYDDCLVALRDPRLGRGLSLRTGSAFGLDTDPMLRQEFFTRAADNMLFADPPDHTRLRKLASKAFTPQRVRALRPAVEQIVAGLLDALPRRVELMEALAYPLPVTVIGELVGVPPAERMGMAPLVRAAAGGIEAVTDPAAMQRALAALDELGAYFRELLAARRAQPRDDLLSALAAARDAGDALRDEEVVATAILLFSAGFETTSNLVGNGLLALLRNPQQLASWRADAAGVAASGVEELLRYDSPVQINMRTALEPAELLGFSLSPGESVVVLQGAGNRDPARFPDPDRLDVTRPDVAPLSFGWGIHHCLGAALARMEAEVVLGALLTRFPRLALDGEPAWRRSITLRGLERLPVDLGS